MSRSASPSPNADSDTATRLALAERLRREVLEPMKAAFVAKDEIIDLMGVSLVAGENLFILGPPGTAKSALVQELGRRLDGPTFEYLLTRFTEPNELFGPFDIRRLREGELVTNTAGMLPEAALVFLDELLNANSAILNSLLNVLNERVFRRGQELRRLPLLMVVGASNHVPEDETLRALYDRFLLRVRSDHVPAEQLGRVLEAGWELETGGRSEPTMSLDAVREVHALVARVDLTGIRAGLGALVHRLRHAGLGVSDRRAVKLQRLIAASAVLCGRVHAVGSDLWVMRHIWDTPEQQEVLGPVVNRVLETAHAAEQASEEVVAHPRSHDDQKPSPEALAEALQQVEQQLQQSEVSAVDRAYLQDRLGLLTNRCQWVSNDTQREALLEQANRLRELIAAASG